MKRLVFIVEGDTEVKFIKEIVIPYLINKEVYNCSVQTITTNRKQHKKGGIGSYEKFCNEIKRTLAQDNVLVTSFIDFYGLPSDFPNFHTKDIDQILNEIRTKFKSNSNFIPYIQKHETEALMYSSIAGFELVIDERSKLDELQRIINDYPNPEEINNSPETAPSKRLKKIFKYDKVADGELIFEMIGINKILEKCPRFSKWINELIEVYKVNIIQ